MVPLPEASITVHALPTTLRVLRGILALVIPGVEGWLGLPYPRPRTERRFLRRLDAPPAATP